jgi:primary-amine oxidase
MDAGEYGFGLQAMPLDPLNDCPRNAYYMDGVFAAGDGTPYVRSHMVCVFESYAGDIGWRHSESPITGMEVRRFGSENLIYFKHSLSSFLYKLTN